jgi:hypothetical protein
VGQHAADGIAFWLFFLNLNWLVRVWQPAADFNGYMAHCKFDEKCAKRPLLSASRLLQADQITWKNSLPRAGGP